MNTTVAGDAVTRLAAVPAAVTTDTASVTGAEGADSSDTPYVVVVPTKAMIGSTAAGRSYTSAAAVTGDTTTVTPSTGDVRPLYSASVDVSVCDTENDVGLAGT